MGAGDRAGPAAVPEAERQAAVHGALGQLRKLFEAAELLLFFNQAKFILEIKSIKEIKMKLAERDGRIRSDSVLNSAAACS